MKPEARAELLRWIRQLTDEDMRILSSDLEHERSRRDSAKLIERMIGERMRFVTQREKNGTPKFWGLGTIVRIHQRSVLMMLPNGDQENVAARNLIEPIEEATYQQIISQMTAHPGQPIPEPQQITDVAAQPFDLPLDPSLRDEEVTLEVDEEKFFQG